MLFIKWLRTFGFLTTPLTPQQIRQQKLAIVAWRIRAVQMNNLYAGTGYRVPFEGW